MTMKVIRQPAKPPDVWKRQRCVKKTNNLGQIGCGAGLEIGESDLIVMLWYGTHFAHNYAGFKCPLCGKYNAAKHVPRPVWERVYKAKKRGQIFDGFDDRV